MSRIETALEKAVRLHAGDSGPAEAPDGDISPDAAVPVPSNAFIVTLTAPASPAAEEYRKLKTMIVKLTRQDVMRNTLMITSAMSGEGKSLTSINLAVSLAQEIGHRALLVDADLRRPTIGEYLGIATKEGLSDCLHDGRPLSEAIIPTGIPKLDFLPAGSPVRNPVELLSSPKMRTVLNELKRQHADRYIIIDTPPILPFAETQVMGLLADSVLLVVREGCATEQDLKDALGALKGAKLLGISFNAMSAVSGNNRYRHYYEAYATRQRNTGTDHV